MLSLIRDHVLFGVVLYFAGVAFWWAADAWMLYRDPSF